MTCARWILGHIGGPAYADLHVGRKVARSVPASPPVSTRTDLDSLDRLVSAKKSDFVEELDADLLEEDDEGSGVQKTQAFRRDEMPMQQQHVPVPIASPVPAPVQPMQMHGTPHPAAHKPIPDPRRIVQQQKEMARQQELARQAEELAK